MQCILDIIIFISELTLIYKYLNWKNVLLELKNKTFLWNTFKINCFMLFKISSDFLYLKTIIIHKFYIFVILDSEQFKFKYKNISNTENIS